MIGKLVAVTECEPMTHFWQRVIGTVRLYAAWFVVEIRALWPQRQSSAASSALRSALLIVRHFPPVVSGGVYRPLSFARFAGNNGWSLDVLAGPCPADPDAAGRILAERIPHDVTVHHIGDREYPTIWKLTPKLDGSFQFALQLFHAFRTRNEPPPQAILVSGPTFDIFVAALLIAKRVRVPLVLDYRDEWNECPFDFVTKTRFGRFWERRCLRAAEAVMFTTASFMEHALVTFAALDRKKCHVVPNGWEQAESDRPNSGHASPEESHERRFGLTFFGALSLHTMPGSLLQALQAAMALQPSLRTQVGVRFVGFKNQRSLRQIEEFPYPEMIELVDHVPANRVGELIDETDALLLLCDHRFERYLPGKMFEYLATDRPVLMFGCDGEAGNIIRGLKAGMVVTGGDGRELVDALHMLMTAAPDSWTSGARRQWAADHTRERSAAKAFQVLNRVI